MTGRLLAIAGAVGSAFVIASCSATSYTEAEGSESGPCYPNGTCNVGLVCASSRCVRLEGDGGGTPDGDASLSDSGVVDSGPDPDADSGDACTSPAAPPPLTCEGVRCGSGQKCCAGVGCKNAGDSCGSVSIECLSPSDCSGLDRCCAVADVVSESSCPTIVTNISSTKCRGGPCTTAEVTLCYATGSTVCDGRACVGGQLVGNVGGNGAVGLCR